MQPALTASSVNPSQTATPSAEHGAARLLPLTVGALGVVFGDIGTSPLYAFREALGQAAADGLEHEEIVGVMSLALWALIIVVTLKYVVFLMRADNDGEGGVLALLALARRGLPHRSGVLIALGAAGASLFYGDAAITPALSVLSAIEGLRSIPGAAPVFSECRIVVITLVILALLFFIQARGTEAVSRLFGPVCIAWFVVIGAIGIAHIADGPGILAAFLPWHAVLFVAGHGVLGLFVLGAVFLTVTGAEALTADMGHFGKRPIRLAWLALVFPALALNYLGQGAFAIDALDHADALHQPFVNQDWFFVMVPTALRLPVVLLATAATIIASQAVITGAFSLTQQAIQLGLLPRLKIKQTSASHAGQIYISVVNWTLLGAVAILVLGFRNSSAMAAAYGIAVTGTMVITSCLAFMVVRYRWNWSLARGVAVVAPFLALDLVFFGANVLRVIEGGWVPLLLAAVVLVLIWTWIRGRRAVAALEADGAVPLADMAAALAKRPPRRTPGTAVYLTGDNSLTPHALLHNLKHNHVLHDENLITTVRTLSKPYADPDERITITPLTRNFARVDLRFGFMELPDVPAEMSRALPEARLASYFIGRNSFAFTGECGMPMWQDVLFILLHRNAADPTGYFHIPPNRVIELGAQYGL